MLELPEDSLDAVAFFLASDFPFSDFEDFDDSLLSLDVLDGSPFDSLFSLEDPVLESVL
ncbi:MAG: hypothetical protein ACFCU2_07945 [Acidimicrobiia bacterium]